MENRIKTALERIRLFLAADGGDVELVSVVDGTVKLRLKGACQGCPMSQLTTKNVIERLLKNEVPEIKSVEVAS
jgi:Fe-S cluster biogenesis protein NfuA